MIPPAIINQEVLLTLADGTKVPGYWDGVQWWTGLEDDDQDAPLVNEFVVSWE